MPTCFFCYEDAPNEGYHAKCIKRFFGTKELPVLTINDKILADLAKQTINQRIAVTGVQPKLSVSLELQDKNPRLTIVGLWGEFILKPKHPHYAEMPEIEDLTMHLASLFKIDVCEHALIPASDGSLVYLAKRFDRKKGKKIHVEDFCQLSEFLTENKYKGSYEKVGKLVKQYCKRGLDMLNYFELLLFCYLSGNNDMHLKNFSLVHTVDGARLSPAYDLLNVNLVNPADNEELALTLNAKKRKIKLSDFISLAKTLSISEKVYTGIFKHFGSKNEEINKLIDASFLSGETKDTYKKIWLQKQLIFS